MRRSGMRQTRYIGDIVHHDPSCVLISWIKCVHKKYPVTITPLFFSINVLMTGNEQK